MTLHEKDVVFDTIEESLKDKSSELLALHPEARVPLLLHDGHVLYESSVITEYIDEIFPKTPLMPPEPASKAQVRLWTYWCNQQFKPHIDHYKYGAHRSSAENVAQAPTRLVQDLDKLEQALQKAPFLMGSNLSLADIHIFPFLRQLSKSTPYFSPLDDFQACQKWLQSIISRPSFEKTMRKRPQSNETA